MQIFGRSLSVAGNLVWKVHVPPKIKFFMWLASQNRCLTADRLAIKGIPHNPICQLCRIHPETASHIFLNCSFSASFWTSIAQRGQMRLSVSPRPSDLSLGGRPSSLFALIRSGSIRSAPFSCLDVGSSGWSAIFGFSTMPSGRSRVSVS